MHSHKDTPGITPHSQPETFQFRPTEPSAGDIPLQQPIQIIPSRGAFAGYVLIVVSDPVECARIGRAFCKLGHSVSLVCDAHDDAAILDSSRFNLVLIEIDPPSPAARLAIKRLLPILKVSFAVLSNTPDEDLASLKNNLSLLTAAIKKPPTENSLRDLFDTKQS